jgi:uncharacterized RDD family membrane protein YckC
MSTSEPALPATQPVALRRLFAFAADLFIIALPATVVGMLLLDPLGDLGQYGRLIGAVLLALYFGYFDSRLGRGRSPGKRWLGLEVVSPAGAWISPARAAARALIATTPFLLPGDLGRGIVPSAIVRLLIDGLALALAYMAICNRPSRRSLHDLATGAMVICRGARLPTARPVWRWHWGVVATIAVVALVAPALPFLADDPSDDPDDIEMQSIGQRVESLAEVRSAKAKVNEPEQTSKAGRDKQVVVVADLRHGLADQPATANAVASAIYRGSEKLIAGRPAGASWAPVTVVLVRSFTLGITSGGLSEKFRCETIEGATGPPALAGPLTTCTGESFGSHVTLAGTIECEISGLGRAHPRRSIR